MKNTGFLYAAIILACVPAGAGELKGMEISLDGSWNVANTSKVDEWPVMVAMKADDRREQNSPLLVISCEKSRGISVYIDWAGGRVLEKNRWVSFQIDEEEEVKGVWDLSAGGYATYFPRYSPSVAEASGFSLPSDFADKLADSENLRASVIMGRETPKFARFRLKGTREALKQVRQGCGRDDLTESAQGNF